MSQTEHITAHEPEEELLFSEDAWQDYLSLKQALAEEMILARIQEAARTGDLQMSLHATEEAHAEHISPHDIQEALAAGQIIENYPEHRRGACCLIYGDTSTGRPLHIVCTSARTPVLIITVYEPRPPKWSTPTQRSRK